MDAGVVENGRRRERSQSECAGGRRRMGLGRGIAGRREWCFAEVALMKNRPRVRRSFYGPGAYGVWRH